MSNMPTVNQLIQCIRKIKNTSALDKLKYFLLFFAVIGFGLSLITTVSTGLKDGFFSLPLCFHKECMESVIKEFEYSFTIAKATLDFLVAVATIGGIIVALLSYLNSSSTAALTNHIAHFSIFQNYVINEVTKRDRISPASVDTLVWYNLIFSTSRSGKTDVSEIYISFVKELNELINQSNAQAERAHDGSFRYVPHQQRIITQLKRAGIDVSPSPRNDFFEMEGQLFSLINRVNQSFCYSDSVPVLEERNYI
jgi:hypothetical protein